MGIDYGEKRIGIAMTDPEGRIAFPRKVIFNRETRLVFDELKTMIEEEKASKIIVGLPLSMDGQETEISGKVRLFVEKLAKFINLPIEFENEILTSHMVQRFGVPQEHTDEAAAAVILQSYLDKSEARNTKS